MRIENASVAMQGSSSVESYSSIQETLNVWSNGSSLSFQSATEDVADWSTDMKSKQFHLTSSKTRSLQMSWKDQVVSSEHELRLKLIQAILNSLTGKKTHVRAPNISFHGGIYNGMGKRYTMEQVDALALGVTPSLVTRGAQSSAGFGIVYNRNEIQSERSRVGFSASGVVKTQDGREVTLNLNVNIDQAMTKQSKFSFLAGDALKDPLIINFDSGFPSFSDRTMTFDLDCDGKNDTCSQLQSNSGFLAIDKNGNGIIDDGKELFGPQTNDGYGELAQYDEDGNGWIDENDSVFQSLKIWYHDEAGVSRLVGLVDKNVGAIYLGNVDTAMNLYHEDEMAGALKQSGFVLLESGETRVMQEIDLKI